ncbi:MULTISPECIES: cytochrome-c oxidase, cbb3-type subunit II [unclassified Thioalkalivibrio]|uniref:cytochrome-c oxidase, cbb3-type subunit II n=1 Tax=unclassified Thioalkalivibrio TaxID=2621013 RepID=UPI000362F5AA|nr:MULTISPECIES: cytochrome-c oxidase, cbb3-type subunit II [unclassified Thioalkalivibrio]
MKHESVETNAGLLIVLTLAVISVGGLVEIVPLFYIDDTVEEVDGVRPYTPLEQRGRDIYIREGCYACHSQMVRPFRDEMLRYGNYSLAAESQYDYPFQWGSKRTGPDLARVGGKYSNEWQVQHLIDPQSLVPESIMPGYPWLAETPLDMSDLEDRMIALRRVGVPYSLTEEEYERNVEKYGEEHARMFDINRAEENLIEQAQAENFDGNSATITEMDAIVAYMQVLGTMVDFSEYDDGHFAEFR